jgi:Ca-activated chloride channel family protein
MLRAAICAAVVIGVGAGLLTAQAPVREQQEPVFRTSTSLVLLDVSVTDHKGRPVRNLEKGSFHIYEDGVEQEVAFFTYEQRPVSWGLVLDRSGSMRGMMDEVYNAALHSVEAGTPEDETFILAFDDRIDMVRPFTTDHASLVKAIREISAGGSTALYDAVRQGLQELRQGRHQKKVLIVVTDGDDNSSRIRFEDLLEKARRSETQVYTIGMFSGMGLGFPEPSEGRIKHQLELLAERTGALAYFPKSIRQCDRACKDIAEQVGRQYAIGYYPKGAEWKGQWRTVQVKVPASPNYSVRAREGYYALGDPSREVAAESPAAKSK